MRITSIVTMLVLGFSGCGGSSNGTTDGGDGSDGETGLPTTLSFSYQRQDVGDPLSGAEIEDFTRKLAAFYKRVGYFPWVLRMSHGVHASTGKPDYMVWWGGVTAFREGDTVRFYHVDPDGGGHNIMIPTPRMLASAIAGFLLTGDSAMEEVATQYCKGISATMLGMVYDQADPLEHLMARNIATFNHSYTTAEGYAKSVDYSGWYTSYEHWNTCRFHYPDNPTWGSVWVTNMRSKDDVPHIFMAVPHIAYAAERAAGTGLGDACGETLELLQAFCADIVDNGFRIRSKDENGEPFIPGYTGDQEKDEAAGDLASFVMWEDLIPNGECNAKRASALIGYGEGRDVECGMGGINNYEAMATSTHYYNYAIVRFFHLAHIANALVNRDDQAAKVLLEGMAERIDTYMDTPDVDLPRSRAEWEKDIALLALRAAAFGFPLTSREARLIHEKWSLGVDKFKDWEYWNLWEEGLADGQYPLHPNEVGNDEHWTRIEDMALLFEYCWSPFRNPAGAEFVDCDILSDPSQWDEGYIDP
jgi:hypothetical protein